MPNYRESSVAGQKWTRAVRFVGENPVGGTPAVTFLEEEAVSFGEDQVVTRSLGGIVETFVPANYAEQFDLLDPASGEVVGSMTYVQVYAAMHSLYMHLATKRDAASLNPV